MLAFAFLVGILSSSTLFGAGPVKKFTLYFQSPWGTALHHTGVIDHFACIPEYMVLFSNSHSSEKTGSHHHSSYSVSELCSFVRKDILNYIAPAPVPVQRLSYSHTVILSYCSYCSYSQTLRLLCQTIWGQPASACSSQQATPSEYGVRTLKFRLRLRFRFRIRFKLYLGQKHTV